MISVELPIETSRLFIRPFNLFDHPNFLKFTLSDESAQYMDLTKEEKTFEGATAIFNQIVEGSTEANRRQIFAVADKYTSQYLGCVGFIPESDGSISLLYTININHTKKGLASEAVNALLNNVREDLTVRVNCHLENLAAQAVATKCGFSRVAVVEIATEANTSLSNKIIFERNCSNSSQIVA